MALLDGLSAQEIEQVLANVDRLSLEDKLALMQEIDELEEQKRLQAARDDFLVFCHQMYPAFKEGAHHRHLKPMLHDMVIDDPAHWEVSERPPFALRLTVSMAPRFGKSITISFLYVAWYLGHNPTHHIMMVTHTATLSEGFGRQIRDLIDTQAYQKIFPETKVSKDKSAAGDWTTTVGGKYLAVGVGANVAGHGAHLLICDDLVSEQAVLANSDTAFETAWNYMQTGPLQRLMPGGRIVMIGCLTAETRVLMADGSEKEIRHVRPGDAVATYEDGKITMSRITNWIEHRPDKVYKIITTSGKIVRANERHPFLVDRNGSREWVRVRNLKVGDCMVQVAPQMGAPDPSKQKDFAPPATSASCGPKAASERSVATGTGASGKGPCAIQTGARIPYLQRGCARPATTPQSGAQVSTASQKRKGAKAISSTATVFLQRITTLCSSVKEAVVRFADNRRARKIQEREVPLSCTSTTATTPTKFVGSCATIATWPSGTQKPPIICSLLRTTYATTPDAIVDITEDGIEAVYDIEVARTENFIANGVVSHNTRWGKKDPIGRALKWAKENPESLPWHEVRFPAVMDVERGGQQVTISLWPEQWPLDQLLAKKAGMSPHFWAAQYMQEPTTEEAALLKREWWQIWEKDDPPDYEFVIQAWDTAHETKNHNDYSACLTWGVWFNERTSRYELILLDAWRGRLEFPDLKEKAQRMAKHWEPEALLIEKKAAGGPLIQELRRTGLFIEELNPSRGARGVSNDKRARVNAVSPILKDKMVWVPDTRWAREVMDECAEFPLGDHDDRVDCVEMALARFRRGGFISLSDDAEDNADDLKLPRRAAYY